MTEPEDDVRTAIDQALQRVPAPARDLDAVRRRGHRVRTRRHMVSALVGLVVAVGVVAPLIVLGPLVERQPRPAASTGSSASSPSVSPPSPGWVRQEASGVSIDTPASWIFNADPVPGLIEPSMLFAVGTGPVPSGGSSCAPTAAIGALPSNGALFFVQEYTNVSEPYTFVPRPSRFDLGPLLGPFECLGVKAHEIAFVDGGRYLQVFVMFGPAASSGLRSEVETSLETLSVQPLPQSMQPSGRCREGVWIACPEAAWVYEVMNAAGVFHLGHVGDRAIRALANGRSFAITTHSEPGTGRATLSCDKIEGIDVCRAPGGLTWRVHGLTVELVPAPSTSATVHSRASLPNESTIRKLVAASEHVSLPSVLGA